MNLVIIDDDLSDIEYFESLLNKNFNNFESIKGFNHPLEGLAYVNKEHPDLLILDMEMLEINGLDLLNRVKSPKTEIIFCTSHAEFAMEAYKNLVLGFLLKPYSESSFIAIISKAMQRLKNSKINTTSKNNANVTNSNLESQFIIVPTLGCTYFIKVVDIVRLESIDSYAKIYLVDGNCHISSYGIKYFESNLNFPIFFRAHKSHLINLTKVSKLFADGTLVLENDERIPVARRRRAKLLELFNTIDNVDL